MEEENLCSFLPDITESDFQQPHPDSRASADHKYINGEQEAIVWGETEVQINQSHVTDQLSLSSKAGQKIPEEAEEWEQIVWPVRPMTCTSTPLSCATVQWDMPGVSVETYSLMNDSSLANKLDSGGVTCRDSTSPSPHQSEDVNAELFVLEEREEHDGSNSQLLSSVIEWTGSSYEPCDAAAQEWMTHEKEDSTHQLLKKIPLRTDSEEEEGHWLTSDPVETVDLINTVEETEVSEDGVDSFVDLKLEEERGESVFLLTGQGNSEEEQTSVNGLGTEEETEKGDEVEEELSEKGDEVEEELSEKGDEVEEELSVTNVSCTQESDEETKTVCSLSDVEVPADPLQADNTGLTINSDKLIDLQQSELKAESLHSGSEENIEALEWLHKGHSEEPEMCKDVDQDSEELEVVAENEEAPTPGAENAEWIDNSQKILELTEKLEEASCLEQHNSDQTTSQDRELSPCPEHSESEQLEMAKESERIQAEVLQPTEQQHFEDSAQLGQSQHLDQAPQMELTPQTENAEQTEEATQTKPVCVEDEESEVAEQQEQQEQRELTEQNEQSPPTTDLSQTETSDQAEGVGGIENGDVQTVVANGEQPTPPEMAAPHMNGGEVERQMARCLAERLYKLDGIQRLDVVKHLDKDNDFSRTVGEEYLKFFDFTGQSLDHALRSFLKVVILIGESQERERVLQHFSCRFHECNLNSFSSSEAVLTLTCALMLLNTDLHGQNVGKSMSSSKFVSNLEGMNDGENFSKDLLKSLYNCIKSEPLEWAVNEEELKSSVWPVEDSVDAPQLRSKTNPFLDIPHDKNATVVKEGFLQRKLHANIDGKRAPWGKRGWKTFYGVLRGMVLYLQKEDYRKDQQTNEEVVSLHHSLAEQAADYTKKPHVFRLQTADWRVFLFQASSKVEMNSWVNRINLVSALHSSPPFPAAVGSQRKFFRPILPASQSAHTLERQLQSHGGMMESFKADLSYLQQNPPEGRKSRAKELEEHRVRAEYLQHEMCRYEIYIQVLEGWKSVREISDGVLSATNLNLFDKVMCADSVGEEDEEEGRLKKSYSSPSLELEMAPPTVIKVKRNISERRTYRRPIIPRRNKEI